jgi:hypothetical protein
VTEIQSDSDNEEFIEPEPLSQEEIYYLKKGLGGDGKPLPINSEERKSLQRFYSVYVKNSHREGFWLTGYNLEKLNRLQQMYQPIEEEEFEKEQYISYFEYADSRFKNVQILLKYKDFMKELLVSNYGSIKYNGIIMHSTVVADGPNKGINGGKNDHYREILFPDLPIKRYTFFTYRLVAEAWCYNPDPDKYTIVHHIGNDSYDNKNNLLFVTSKQHLSIQHNRLKTRIISLANEEDRMYLAENIIKKLEI